MKSCIKLIEASSSFYIVMCKQFGTFPSLTICKAFYFRTTTSLQSQCSKIASRMQSPSSLLISNSICLEARNDESGNRAYLQQKELRVV